MHFNFSSGKNNLFMEKRGKITAVETCGKLLSKFLVMNGSLVITRGLASEEKREMECSR
jgi:hypothetical protein